MVSPVQAYAADSTGTRELPPEQTVNTYLKSYLGRLNRLDATSSSSRIEIDGQLQRFYKALNYRAAWTNRKAIARLVEIIGECGSDGLNPSDYHYGQIKEFAANPPGSPALKAKADLLMTDALFSLMSHLRFGKVMPGALDSNWNIPVPKPATNYDQMLMSAVMGSKFPEMIAVLRNPSPKYVLLRKNLLRYRKIAENGGWQPVYQGPNIEKVGQVDKRMPLVRQRLILSGDLSPDAPLSSIKPLPADSSATGAPLAPPIPPDRVYTQELFDAVRAFQQSHGLSADGIIGIETLNAMNYPAELRANQIRVNLERERWYDGILGRTYVMVNIPAFSVEYVKDNEVRWTSRVIVGKPNTQTPIFAAQIQSVIFNPHWVIPPGILAKEAIPAIRKDVGYLAKYQLTVVDSNGKPVDPSRVNWYSDGGFPYRLVQASGDDGALGRIKFNMPNRFNVYMHDTPTKPLFERSYRAYSHGCVRVDRPYELAEYLMRDSENWSLSKIKAAIDTGKTRTIPLTVKVPVYFFYQTAFADGNKIGFRDDIYDRDKELLDALNSDKWSRSVEEATR
ncbi:L,D-transpeptidase family protein [Chlorobaculum sp. MV4-Y]|uniref:L,D-transpeptidase family protein n=1 Tax=Chlorobaculum sp. MV4-Y TaxID=2976335 RepID=UPI0021AF137D|nr:L,D-transpeptidase family protein [Chlorobaculum sp. MV4-Y]UWX57279.1 L,D-transpeptidase family protein [Chlorobaculum sp. MV4-Y]